MSARPVIALLTDFGTTDHYVGVMKAVMAGICPDALTIDITHAIAPQDVRGAALQLAAAWRYLPAETICLGVVDPGVGTGRPAVAVDVGDRIFVGPDNGLLDMVIGEQTVREGRTLSNPDLALPDISCTFEGRDRFAPAAAWLARGTPLSAFGPLAEVGVRLVWPQPRLHVDRVVGQVLHVDRFGNLITNLDCVRWGSLFGRSEVWMGGRGPIPVVRTYGDVAAGALVALVGSTGRLEVAVAGGSAADTLGTGAGAEVQCVWRA